ncbi:hypothetical protein Pmar_PMAR009277 [Perkinsus marinus ATCC 50983]|uniref:Uncharacterized protein n=1 Tax=Perkinsus marinus (strain ATCC 50983 / TXsc) TaxID=423536 RepID=C5L266_PERM5|nr:hypothetical protein Pmar_PMAR009277 [Perkinsus marinus ATCC 50983]EER09177.1 hypothetical protein Pmar_PMAR009277 [Perkinsus marinus ATCC 50983]|eukprot:XP_002777361.1 hypothetical protein Pmar_PMAR009277 [Perkinsus marinus ATCC 50983]
MLTIAIRRSRATRECRAMREHRQAADGELWGSTRWDSCQLRRRCNTVQYDRYSAIDPTQHTEWLASKALGDGMQEFEDIVEADVQ